MSDLERRYRRLLNAYPASYRAERGDEMLGTLLEASEPGQSRPAARDVRALLLGGLRARAWQGQQQCAGVGMRQIAFLAAVLVLVEWSLTDWYVIVVPQGFAFPTAQSWLQLALAVLFTAAAVAAWSSRRALVTVIAVPTGGLTVYQSATAFPDPSSRLALAIVPVLALTVVAIMVGRGERLPRPWLFVTGFVALAFLLADFTPASGILRTVVLVAVIGAGIVWSVVDARLLTAAVLWYAVVLTDLTLQQAAFDGLRYFNWWLVLMCLAGLLIAAGGTWLVRRQAVL